MFKILLLAVLAVSCAQAADQKVVAAFTKAKIVPTFIKTSPSEGMTLEFQSSAGNVKSSYGNKLAVADVAIEPYTQWELPSDESIEYYSLIAVDLDAASSGTGYLLWLNSNITGDYAGDIDFEYKGPTGTNHRVAFLVFTQKAFIDFDSSLKRENFNVASYASKHGLTILAGNFFYTK